MSTLAPSNNTIHAPASSSHQAVADQSKAVGSPASNVRKPNHPSHVFDKGVGLKPNVVVSLPSLSEYKATVENNLSTLHTILESILHHKPIPVADNILDSAHVWLNLDKKKPTIGNKPVIVVPPIMPPTPVLPTDPVKPPVPGTGCGGEVPMLPPDPIKPPTPVLPPDPITPPAPGMGCCEHGIGDTTLGGTKMDVSNQAPDAGLR